VKVFVDTSAWLALLDEDDRHHGEARALFEALIATAELVTHNYVEVETLALARRRLGSDAVARLTDDLLPALTTVWVDEPLHRIALAAHRAGGASVSLVDRVSFEVIRREGIGAALAFDADFDAQGFARPTLPTQPGRGSRLAEAPAPYGASATAADLVSVSEIAARAGRPINTIQSWRRRHRDFPAPVAALAAGPVWTWPDVERWIAGRAARSRRPTTTDRQLASAAL
jgi:predicted nucleic acid-binding protein